LTWFLLSQAATDGCLKRTAKGGQRSRRELTDHLLVDPSVNVGRAEPPELADMHASDTAQTSELLKSFRRIFMMAAASSVSSSASG
jgi:hypothetical protein